MLTLSALNVMSLNVLPAKLVLQHVQAVLEAKVFTITSALKIVRILFTQVVINACHACHLVLPVQPHPHVFLACRGFWLIPNALILALLAPIPMILLALFVKLLVLLALPILHALAV